MAENGSRGARRCLFGREDPEILSQELAEQVKKEEKASADEFEKKWNFRINNETPLPGRYQWEKIGNNPSEPTTSRGLSHLPPSPVDEEVPVINITVKASPEISDGEKSSSEDKSMLSSSSVSDSDVSKSADEKDVNQNIVRESTKRKASKPLLRDETLEKEAKRAKPP